MGRWTENGDYEVLNADGSVWYTADRGTFTQWEQQSHKILDSLRESTLRWMEQEAKRKYEQYVQYNLACKAREQGLKPDLTYEEWKCEQ